MFNSHSLPLLAASLLPINIFLSHSMDFRRCLIKQIELMTRNSISNTHTVNASPVGNTFVCAVEFLVEAAFWYLGTITSILFGFLIVCFDVVAGGAVVVVVVGAVGPLLRGFATVENDWWADDGGIDDVDDESMSVDWLIFDNKWLMVVSIDISVDVINLVASLVSIITGIDLDMVPVTLNGERKEKTVKKNSNSFTGCSSVSRFDCIFVSLHIWQRKYTTRGLILLISP